MPRTRTQRSQAVGALHASMHVAWCPCVAGFHPSVSSEGPIPFLDDAACAPLREPAKISRVRPKFSHRTARRKRLLRAVASRTLACEMQVL